MHTVHTSTCENSKWDETESVQPDRCSFNYHFLNRLRKTENKKRELITSVYSGRWKKIEN